MSATPDYSGFEEEVDSVDLAHVRTQAAELLAANEELARAREAVERAETRVKHLSREVLPELLERAQLSGVDLRDGIRIELENVVHGSILKGREPEAHEFMAQTGHDALIKRVFAIRFGRGDEAWARKFERDLRQRKRPLDVVRTERVESQTLKKYVRERLEEGVELPPAFSVHEHKEARVRLPKGS